MFALRRTSMWVINIEIDNIDKLVIEGFEHNGGTS